MYSLQRSAALAQFSASNERAQFGSLFISIYTVSDLTESASLEIERARSLGKNEEPSAHREALCPL